MPGKSLENMHVAVLAGGHSAEREISLNSGKNVVVALKEAGYTSVELLDTAADDFMVTMATGGFDVAFIAMHGAGGEDGAMQGAMETLGIPYTASGVLASACGADKEVSKLLYAKAGIPIAPGLALEVGDEVDIDHIVEVCGERCFVKPAVNGSSYGISLVHEPSELPAAIAKAFEYGDKFAMVFQPLHFACESGGEGLAALGATAVDQRAACAGAHANAEAALHVTAAVIRLECPLHTNSRLI